MRLHSTIVALTLACVASPARSCPPLLPGQTETERLKPGFDHATDIVYGVVRKGARAGKKARFEVLHVYKGSLAPGQIIEAVPTYGFDPPPCLGMIQLPPPSTHRGEYGVVAFHNREPALNFITQPTLRLAFKEGWIKSAER